MWLTKQEEICNNKNRRRIVWSLCRQLYSIYAKTLQTRSTEWLILIIRCFQRKWDNSVKRFVCWKQLGSFILKIRFKWCLQVIWLRLKMLLMLSTLRLSNMIYRLKILQSFKLKSISIHTNHQYEVRIKTYRTHNSLRVKMTPQQCCNKSNK